MNKVVRVLTPLAFALLLGAHFTAGAYAQERIANGKATVTGCLQKGDEPGEYSITGSEGKTYGLRSQSVDLSKHLGHKVTVVGTLKPESTQKAEAQESKSKEMNEAGDIRVTTLQMVSEKCQ